MRLSIILLVVGILVAVMAGTVLAQGFDGTGMALADKTSVMIRLNIPHQELVALAPSEMAGDWSRAAGGPGLAVSYFDKPVIVLMPAKSDAEVLIGNRKQRILAILVVFPKPDGFDRRWPLVPEVDSGAYFVLAGKRAGRAFLALAQAQKPHQITILRTRKPEYGSVPGAMMGQQEVHPIISDLAREGCAFAISAVAGERVLVADLIR